MLRRPRSAGSVDRHMHGWLAWMRKFAGDCRHLRLAENWKDSLQNTSWRRHGYLMGLQERNERLFFKVLMTHTRELLPIIDLPVRSLRLPRARCGCTSTVSSHITCTDCVGLTAGSSHACADGILSSHHPVFHVWNRRRWAHSARVMASCSARRRVACTWACRIAVRCLPRHLPCILFPASVGACAGWRASRHTL